MKRWLLLLLLSALGCDGQRTPPTRAPKPTFSSTPAPAPAPEPTIEAKVAPSAAPEPEPVRVEAVDVPSGRRVFVLRGARGHRAGVFLHGLCGHPKFYLASFQEAAADFGPFIAPNGDMPCNGEYRSWSGKLAPLEEQITAGLHAAGVEGEPTDVTLIGYSMGGSRALELARRAPQRYTRLILISTPETPSPKGLAALAGVVMMAGTRDRQDLMKAGARAFAAAGVPSTFMALPGAAHGEMGAAAEASMKQALNWLETEAKQR